MNHKALVTSRHPELNVLRGHVIPRSESFSVKDGNAHRKPGTSLTKKQILRRVQWLERHMSMIPPNPADPICDPGGSIQKTGVMRPKEFWYWYHIMDGPDVSERSPWSIQMARIWGQLWFDYLVVDELVLSGAIPLILQKRSQMTRKDEGTAIRTAEVRALQILQKYMGDLRSPASRGGLVISISARVQIAISQRQYDVAQIHLGAIRKILEIHLPSRAEWLCAVWSDLRVASTIGSAPMLLRNVPDTWKDEPVPSQNESKFQRLAMQNVRALNHVMGDDFATIFGLFRRLHGLQARVQAGPIPIESYYHAIYDCCELQAKNRVMDEQQLSPDVLATQVELLAICLKLAAWEKASVCIPRGGEIERTLLDRAMYLLELHGGALNVKSSQGAGVNDSAFLWIMFSLAATAYMFQRSMMPAWIVHLQSITTLSTPRALQRALEAWPSAPWWYSSAVHHICESLSPIKGRWKVIGTEKDPVPNFVDGLRLKLVIIDE